MQIFCPSPPQNEQKYQSKFSDYSLTQRWRGMERILLPDPSWDACGRHLPVISGTYFSPSLPFALFFLVIVTFNITQHFTLLMYWCFIYIFCILFTFSVLMFYLHFLKLRFQWNNNHYSFSHHPVTMCHLERNVDKLLFIKIIYAHCWEFKQYRKVQDNIERKIQNPLFRNNPHTVVKHYFRQSPNK